MQEEVDEKTIAFCVRGVKLTAGVLKAILMKWLHHVEENRRIAKSEKREEKRVERAAVQKAKENQFRPGRKSLNTMMKEGSQLSNIEITDKNIKSFEKVARKYSIDYSLKKDKSVDPPMYLVFFKAKDVDVMTAAFKEYTGVTLNKSRKVSIRKRLQKAIQRSAKHREREKVRQKEKGQER